MTVLKSKTLTISIQCAPQKIYEFVSNLENLPKWATTFCRSIRPLKNEWVIRTPQGEVSIHIAAQNVFGILDHYISPRRTSTGVKLYVPMRVVANGRGSEVTFTLFQPPGMSDENYAKDIRLVKKDLNTLKKVMETR